MAVAITPAIEIATASQLRADEIIRRIQACQTFQE